MRFYEWILAIIFVIAIIAIIFGGVVVIKSGIDKIDNKETGSSECNHEFVTTSEFSLLSRNGYRVVSKCIKCGYTVR